MIVNFEDLRLTFEGELYYENSPSHNAIKKSYSTDASVYQEKPLAVALPKTPKDVEALIGFARAKRYTLIPRAAGTSLAGQVVGNGIVVDISKYFTSILEVNDHEKWVRTQPGVIRDDLNFLIKSTKLMFGPETSTANRAMIGGMVGNNSCGLHSIIWGDTRSNIVALNVLLSDGSTATFRDLSQQEFEQKLELQTLEGSIYRGLHQIMENEENRRLIVKNFPNPLITRRNSGYALDALIGEWNNKTFNLSRIVAGSEGTLCFVLEAKLKLLDLPPAEKGIVAVHTRTIREALLANLVALRHHCSASELVDDIILEYTKTNIDQSRNRFFVEGDPKAILMVEFFDETGHHLGTRAREFINDLQQAQLGYAYPLLLGSDCLKAWDLRKAGLGLLRNEPGDIQPVNLIEDCAVAPEDLPSYIAEVEAMLQGHNTKYSMYAHAGAGELHVEPMINLKTSAGKHLFRTILSETAQILKKYNGSLSGEHGDGRLRGEFIPFMMGEGVYQLFKNIKTLFDPLGVFNKGKIVDTPPMNEFLRYQQDQAKPTVNTVFNFTREEGILHLAEKCSGSGDCRKSAIGGGTMCPSYMATRSERDTTRARANMLRHFYTHSGADRAEKAQFDEVLDVLDLCLSCKGCKSECPSSVDVGKMKAEFTQQYYDRFGIPFRSKLIGQFTSQMKLASLAPFVYNGVFKTAMLRRAANRVVGFHPSRSMPSLHKVTLRKWHEKRQQHTQSKSFSRSVYLFCDEFTNYNDVPVGQKTILLLEALGYKVIIPEHVESGRTFLSKGFVRDAIDIARRNVSLLANLVSAQVPIVGIEPSAILTLRDEYRDLVGSDQTEAAKHLAKHAYLFDEWFSLQIEEGNIPAHNFTKDKKVILVHGHCHQKALSRVSHTLKCLSLPENFVVQEIPSGCCGMAGAFGYEKEHYDVSMQIGELVLFPAIRQAGNDVIIAASGTSCRHQVKDGTGRIAKHPAEILYEALSDVPEHTKFKA